jgi:phthiocerol/phenolphthiocerol synthesis type-I polyketide synthase E
VPLPAQRAFHSSALRCAAAELAPELAAASWSAPRIPWLSCVSGDWLGAELDAAKYFGDQLCAPVRFADAASKLAQASDWLVLEVGPGQTLSRLYEQVARATQGSSLEPALPSLPETGASDRRALLGTLGRLWAAGASSDFAGLWSEAPPQRVALPTTPFERQRHWLPERARAPHAAAPSGVAPELAPTASLALPSWQRSSWPAAAESPLQWLLLAGAEPCAEQELLTALEAELRATGRQVLCVRAGAALADGASLQLDREQDLRQLLQAAAARSGIGVIHAGALTAAPLAVLEPAGLEQAQRAGSLSVLALLRVLLGEGLRARLLVLGSGLADLTGNEAQRPEHAPLIGLCRSVRHESREVACSLLDVELQRGDGNAAAVARRVLREALGPGSDAFVAQRGARRWLPGVSALALPEAGASLRERAVVVVSGGLGGVGAALGEALARAARARLVLFGRSRAPERERELAVLLEPLGAECLFLQADVTRRDELERLRGLVLERFGAVHGLVHAAGVEGGGVLQRLSAQHWLAELAPKLTGALLLEQVFAGDALDFVAYTSSLTALSGGLGQAGYAAANAGLDALARAASGRGRRVLSLGFDRWLGLGMAARSDERLRAAGLAGVGARGLTRAAGQQAWLRLLQADAELEQVLVSAQALTGLPEGDLLAASLPAAESARGSSSAPEGARELDAGQLRARLAELWQQVLGRAPADPEQSFFEQGGESLLALAILNRVRQSFGVELALREFFLRPTLAGLCDAVSKQLGAGGVALDAGPALVALPRTAQRRGGSR